MSSNFHLCFSQQTIISVTPSLQLWRKTMWSLLKRFWMDFFPLLIGQRNGRGLAHFCWGKGKNTASPDVSPCEDDPTCALSFIELPPKIARDKKLLFLKKSNHCARRWLRRSRTDESNLWLALKGWWNSLWMRAHSLISSIFISPVHSPVWR